MTFAFTILEACAIFMSGATAGVIILAFFHYGSGK